MTSTTENIYQPNMPDTNSAQSSTTPVSSLITGPVGFKRKNKVVDVSQFSNLRNNMQSFNNDVYNPNNHNITPNPSITSLGTITTPFGGSTKIEKQHEGVDVANKIGTPIPSFAEGTVVDVQSGYGQNKKFTNDKSAWGNSIVVKDKNGNFWRYSHLLNTYVKAGQQIAKGQQLGQMGASGNTYSTSGGTGSHLDLRLWKLINGQKQYLNPLTAKNT